MFSSTDYTATNPLPQIPVTSATFHGGSHHILLPQLHQDHYLFPNTHTLVSPNNNNNVNNSKPRRVTKKDRHTKILTAQGPRDRRVRLSICIARKFFDLQDTLGFDKPSKTLNWLFAKSKLAIEDLIQTTTTIHAKMGPIKEEEDVIKVSRAKARARARARTIKKMCIKELNEAKMLLAAPTPEPGPLAKNELTPSRVCSVWDIPQHLMMPKNSGLGGCGGGGDNGGYSHNASTTIMSSQGLEICTKSWGFSDHNYQY